ncbi:hypothetical protein A2U01_0004080 [Trifolium medium]|uniref:Uncharacterized protein n=1 Tax=Trifolium medium TaxID=97028 RepID=A0A392M7G5_9FABA|nr:hypothetical protein [Trifolium medium]
MIQLRTALLQTKYCYSSLEIPMLSDDSNNQGVDLIIDSLIDPPIAIPNQYGIGPDNLLSPRSNIIISLQFFKETGNFPLKVLFRNINTLSLRNDPIEEGTSPDKELLLKSRNSSAFK